MAEKKPIFLYDPNLVAWEGKRVLKAGTVRADPSLFHHCSTVLKECLGKEYLEEYAGGYEVRADVSMYRADVVLINESINKEDDERKPRDQIIFDGGIVIFKNSKIPGTELEGDYVAGQGRIWTSYDYSSDPVLRRVILGKTDDQRTMKDRLERIIQGYEIQRQKRIPC